MGGAPPGTYGRPSVAYVTPSRRATRTALSNSSSARACHLDVATLRRFSPATGGGEGGGGGAAGRGLKCPPHRRRRRRCNRHPLRPHHLPRPRAPRPPPRPVLALRPPVSSVPSTAFLPALCSRVILSPLRMTRSAHRMTRSWIRDIPRCPATVKKTIPYGTCSQKIKSKRARMPLQKETYEPQHTRRVPSRVPAALPSATTSGSW